MGSDLTQNPLRATDLYALADAIQIELGAVGARITGQTKETVRIPDLGFRMAFEAKVVSSRLLYKGANVDEIALIVKLRGNLHLLVLEDNEGMLHAFTLDASDFDDLTVKKFEGWFEDQSLSLSALVLSLISKSKHSWVRAKYDAAWVEGSPLA